MNNNSIKKYIFFGGIMNHMYEYIRKYNIINTLGYGNGYKLFFNNIHHYNLTEIMYPEYEYPCVFTTKDKMKNAFVHVGRFSIEKNQLFLIKAFHSFIKEINNFSYKLYIIYRNNNKITSDINDYIELNNLNNNIILLDWMSQQELFDFCVNNIDYNILTSANEGTNSVCIEFMKLGIPTISSNICCINEILVDEVNGLLFDYHNYFNILNRCIKYKNPNLVSLINKHIDINTKSFISVIKKTINNLALLNKLSANCIKYSNILSKDDYHIFIE